MGQVATMPEKTRKGKKQSEIELLTRIAEILSAKRRRELLDFAKFLSEADEDRILASMIAEVSDDKVYSREEAIRIYAEMKGK